jgi:hypothetical protein
VDEYNGDVDAILPKGGELSRSRALRWVVVKSG